MKEEMTKTEETTILNKLYQCAEMGVVGIDTVIEKSSNEEFTKLLLEQKVEYETICQEVIEILKKYGCEEKKLGTMAKKSSEMMTDMKMKIDHSDSQIAKMMMEGNNKGIIEVTKLKNEYEGDDEEIQNLIDRFLDTQEHNLNEMKSYL